MTRDLLLWIALAVICGCDPGGPDSVVPPANYSNAKVEAAVNGDAAIELDRLREQVKSLTEQSNDLQRQLREQRWKISELTSALLGDGPGRTFDEIRTRALVVVDKKGEPKARFAVADHGPYLRLSSNSIQSSVAPLLHDDEQRLQSGDDYEIGLYKGKGPYSVQVSSLGEENVRMIGSHFEGSGPRIYVGASGAGSTRLGVDRSRPRADGQTTATGPYLFMGHWPAGTLSLAVNQHSPSSSDGAAEWSGGPSITLQNSSLDSASLSVSSHPKDSKFFKFSGPRLKMDIGGPLKGRELSMSVSRSSQEIRLEGRANYDPDLALSSLIRPKVELTVDHESEPRVKIVDREGRNRIELGSTELVTTSGPRRGTSTRTPTSSITLFDEEGQVSAKLP